MIRKLWFVFIVINIVLLTACGTAKITPTAQTNLPNPASVYCEQNGGKLDLRQDASGRVAGVCVFPDSSECDEWAYFRDECKPGDSLPAQGTYNDPFAYCAAIGTIDTPDARYTGPQISEEIINGYKIAAGLQASTEPMEMFKKTTIWRCMNNQVYACNFGANLSCSSKANTDRTPSPAMEEYCKTNPDSDFIPMSVTSHTTIYSWRCVKDTPEVLEQIEKVDAAGYLANIWYPIVPGTASSDVTATPLGGGVGQIVFYSNRGNGYEDIYLLDIGDQGVTPLVQRQANSFSGPFSPDGKQILFTGFGLTHSYIGIMNADGNGQTDLTNQPNSDEAFPAWSPDGKQIAFTSRRDGSNDIYVMNADGSDPKRLTYDPKDDFAPDWSLDGSRIAFVSDGDNQSGIYSLYVMNADGTSVTRLTKDKSIDYAPDWSPNGTKIAYYSVRDGQADIYVINADGSDETNLTNNPADDSQPRWSPDGSWIVFQTNRDGNWEIYLMDAEGGNLMNLTNNPADDQLPYWKP